MNQPHGVAYRNGALYVAEIDRILRFDQIEQRLDAPPQPVVIVACIAARSLLAPAAGILPATGAGEYTLAPGGLDEISTSMIGSSSTTLNALV